MQRTRRKSESPSHLTAGAFKTLYASVLHPDVLQSMTDRRRAPAMRVGIRTR